MSAVEGCYYRLFREGKKNTGRAYNSTLPVLPFYSILTEG
jgi:hypothetical protein